MKLWVDGDHLIVERDDGVVRVDVDIDEVFRSDDPAALIGTASGVASSVPDDPRAPIGNQEVWAAGVTYFISREARIEESEASKDAYQRVYDADRPELFFKSTAARVVHPGEAIRIRRDSMWNVPEPELTLAINAAGRIFGFTIGNDMSSRDIEGENPLYLPQAKVYDGSAAVGPCIVVQDTPPPTTTVIGMAIERAGEVVFEGSTSVGMIKRSFVELVDYLFSEMSFPDGCLLMTGAGVVPERGFTLAVDDQVCITIDGIGELRNHVEMKA